MRVGVSSKTDGSELAVYERNTLRRIFVLRANEEGDYERRSNGLFDHPDAVVGLLEIRPRGGGDSRSRGACEHRVMRTVTRWVMYDLDDGERTASKETREF